MDYKKSYIMKTKTRKILLWTIFAISALLLVLVTVFPGDSGNDISIWPMVMMIAFGLWGVIYASYRLKKKGEITYENA